MYSSQKGNARTVVVACCVFHFALFFPVRSFGQQGQSNTNQPRKAAVFVLSREPKVGTQQVKILEDLIAARTAGQGFQTLTRDIVVDSIARSMKHPAPGITAKESAFLSEFTSAWKKNDMSEKSLEDQLDEQSSIMRLAQTIGADLIVIAVAESYGTEKRIFKGNELAPVATTTIFNSLLVSYRYIFAASGGAVSGDVVRVSRAWRESEGLTRETDDLLNGMFDEVAVELSKKIVASDKSVKDVPKVEAAGVVFSVRPVMPGGVPIQLPSYQSNDVVLTPSVTVAADVLLDGVAIGSIPGNIRMATGLHQILVQAEGYQPWKRFINVLEGQQINIQMEMTPEGYEKWKDIVGFLSDLSQKAKLTAAEVKQIEAKAEAMREAHIIVNIGRDGADAIRR
jgi:hypothetical protein